MTNMTLAFRLGRTARVFSPGIYLVTGRLECKPLLLCSARILWMNQDCTIRGGGGGSDWQSHRPTFWFKIALFWHLSSRIGYFPFRFLIEGIFLLDLVTTSSPHESRIQYWLPFINIGFIWNALWGEKREPIYKYWHVTNSWTMETWCCVRSFKQA